MPKFEKGQSGNPQGRPKGSQNKATRQAREALADFTNGKLQELETIWTDLSPKDKADFLSKVLPYIAPKLSAQAVELTSGENTAPRLPDWMQEN